MSAPHPAALCPQAQLDEAVAAARVDEEEGLAQAGRLAALYPSDPRPPFLCGSLLAGLGRYSEAAAALQEALSRAPAFALARFQLGLLQLSCGDAPAALATWEPLGHLDRDHPLRLFAAGLAHLARDEFDEAAEHLERGIKLNAVNAPLNGNMQLIIDEIIQRRSRTEPAAQTPSAAHLLLQMYGAKPTKH